MKSNGLFSQKVSPGVTLLILTLIAIPAFFWFRHLYVNFFVMPDMMTPEQQKMVAGMKQAYAGKSLKPSSSAAKKVSKDNTPPPQAKGEAAEKSEPSEETAKVNTGPSGNGK